MLITKSWSSKAVCIYFKESLPLTWREDLTNIKDCLVTDINVNNEKCFFTCVYRSPSQSHDELGRFCTKFDLLPSNINNPHPTCSIDLGDFYARSSKWFASDKDNTAGIELDLYWTHLVIIKWLINQLITSMNRHHVLNFLLKCKSYEKLWSWTITL